MAVNSNDNTTLLGSGGDTISDEYVDPNGMARQNPNAAATAFKLPRSKIAVGQYGVDAGDATQDTPLAVESRNARQAAELMMVRAANDAIIAECNLDGQQSYHYSLVDNRGSYMDSRGGGVR